MIRFCGSRLCLLLATVLPMSCGGGGSSGGGGGDFGLSQRIQVSGLTFPTGLPQPQSMVPVRAFPNLVFNRPLFLTAPPDGSNRIFVVEQNGVIRVFPNDENVIASTVFLDIRTQVLSPGGEEGLLGFALAPDYAASGYFYTYYSVASPRRTRLSRWRVSTGDPNLADASSEEVLLSIPQPFSNHNGGSMAFGPDGMLYLAVGDGGSGNDPQNNAQDLTNLLGKVLRLAADGSIPPDNPFVSGVAGERGEIWAYGLRNPWRGSFDRSTGDLWLGDVGQNSREEIDIILRGRNYGWRVYEGDQSNINPNSYPPSAYEQPIVTYSHQVGRSVTGGYVYRGSRLADLIGAYLYADFGSGRVWALVREAGQVLSNELVASVPTPASFGEDEAGELYICSFDGNIYRLEESNPGAGGQLPPTLSATGLFSDVPSLTPSPGLIEYQVNSPLWSDNAIKRRWLALPGTARMTFDPIEAWDLPISSVLVKHFEIEVSPGQIQRLETRVLLKHSMGWQGYSYRWNPQQTDADLLSTSATELLTISDGMGGQRLQTWYYPSRNDCLACHTSAAGRVLGLRTRQMNRNYPYPAHVDNQLRTWNHIELFTQDIGSSSQYEALPDPMDSTLPLADRARSYLAANCANCHLPAGPTPVDMDLRYSQAMSSTNTLAVLASNPTSPGALRIMAGNKEQSDLWERLRRRDAFGMPSLGSNLVHQAAVDLLGLWIDSGAGN